MSTEHKTQQDEYPELLDQWATLNFDTKPKPQPTTPVEGKVAVLTPETGDNPQKLELEPLNFDDDTPITIETGERPFQKKPKNKILLALITTGCVLTGIGLFINAGKEESGKVFAENGTKTQDQTAPSDIPTQDPKDQTIGQLRSDQASSTLKGKIDALNKRKELDAKVKAKLANRTISGGRVAAAPVQSTYSSLPPASNPDPVPFHSIPRDPSPYTPAYRPASSIQNYEPQQAHQPKPQPKMLAFGGLPEEKNSNSSSSVTQPVTEPAQTTGYQPASYTTPSQPAANATPSQGFDTQGSAALDEQQQTFLRGGRLTRIAVNASSAGTITSGAILPGRFSVQIGSPLSGIPAGTTLLFETKMVYPNGKLEAYAIGVVSGDYQRVQPVPAGAIALLSGDGNLLKAQQPGAGFMSSAMGRGLFGAVQGAAGRFLATGSVISQSNSGTLLSQGAGGKGFSDLAAGALQGGLSPMLQSLPQQQTTDDKSFSLEPGKKVTVKVVQPFNFSF
jgi:hypothetical protein